MLWLFITITQIKTWCRAEHNKELGQWGNELEKEKSATTHALPLNWTGTKINQIRGKGTSNQVWFWSSHNGNQRRLTCWWYYLIMGMCIYSVLCNKRKKNIQQLHQISAFFFSALSSFSLSPYISFPFPSNVEKRSPDLCFFYNCRRKDFPFHYSSQLMWRVGNFLLTNFHSL